MSDETTERWVLVERTLTVRMPVKMSAYPGFTEQQVQDYEKSRELDSIVGIIYDEAGSADDAYQNGVDRKMSISFHDENPMQPWHGYVIMDLPHRPVLVCADCRRPQDQILGKFSQDDLEPGEPCLRCRKVLGEPVSDRPV